MNKNFLKRATFLSLTVITMLNNGVVSLANNTNKSSEITSIERDSRVQSAKIEKTVYGILYHNYTNIARAGDGYTYGSTHVETKNGSKVQVGYMGAHVNMYKESTGKVVATFGWQNNTSSASYQAVMCNYKDSGLYVKGTTRAYNGGGYTTWTANRSVTISRELKEMGIEISAEELAEREYLYENKGMIAAVGINDIEGYVIEDDLLEMSNAPTSPEEAIKIELENKEKGFKLIPLYANDGSTVIGEYKINYNNF